MLEDRSPHARVVIVVTLRLACAPDLGDLSEVSTFENMGIFRKLGIPGIRGVVASHGARRGP